MTKPDRKTEMYNSELKLFTVITTYSDGGILIKQRHETLNSRAVITMTSSEARELFNDLNIVFGKEKQEKPQALNQYEKNQYVNHPYKVEKKQEIVYSDGKVVEIYDYVDLDFKKLNEQDAIDLYESISDHFD